MTTPGGGVLWAQSGGGAGWDAPVSTPEKAGVQLWESRCSSHETWPFHCCPGQPVFSAATLIFGCSSTAQAEVGVGAASCHRLKTSRAAEQRIQLPTVTAERARPRVIHIPSRAAFARTTTKEIP